MKYNDTGIEVSYIENLLYNNYIPNIPFGKIPENYSDIINTCYLDTLHIYDNENNILSEYEFGKNYPNLTNNFISNTSYYSSDLHEALGRYIKFYDEFYKIPLKGMYNCFSNRWIDNYEWKKAISGSDNYKTFLVPIRYFHKYSIYLQATNTVYVRPLFYNGTNEIKINSAENLTTTLLDGVIEEESIYPTENIPAVYDAEKILECTEQKTNIKNLYLRQNMLYLAVSVHNSFTGKIVVIEDDNVVINDSDNRVLNKELLSDFIKESIPYSSKLLSYIMDRVITPVSNPHYIEQVQEKIKKIDNSFIYKKGIFDADMQNYLIHLFGIDIPQTYGETISDLTGYVDRDIEEWLDSRADKIGRIVNKSEDTE